MGQGERDKKSGQYTPRFDRLCRCGHVLGDHDAAGNLKERECHHFDCDCEGFQMKTKINPLRGAALIRRHNLLGVPTRDIPKLIHHLAQQRHAAIPKTRHLYGVIAARDGKKMLYYDGKAFSARNTPRKFSTFSAAETYARVLLKKHPELKKFRLMIRTAT